VTNREAGEVLVREAHRIFDRDLRAAWEDRDYNLVVRRAQEAVELALKGALRILGVDFPKVHDVGPIFVREARRKGGVSSEEELAEVQRISAWLAEARAPAFYLERPYGEDDARTACDGARFVLDVVTRVVGG